MEIFRCHCLKFLQKSISTKLRTVNYNNGAFYRNEKLDFLEIIFSFGTLSNKMYLIVGQNETKMSHVIIEQRSWRWMNRILILCTEYATGTM